MSRNQRIISFFIAALIAASASTYLRLIPSWPAMVYNIPRMAKALVKARLSADVARHVQESYPNMPEENKRKMVNIGLKTILNENPDKVAALVKDATLSLKENAPEDTGKTYLIEADSYYYLGLTKNLIEKGTLSSSIENGRYYNPLMMAPKGHRYYFDLHPYAGLFTYRTASLLRPGISLERAVALTPIALNILFVILYFIFCYLSGISALAAFISSAFILSAPMYFQRSLFGWYDTDPYNIIFPITLLFCLLNAVTPAKKLASRIKYTVTAGLSSAFYTMFWSGWVSIFLSSLLAVLSVLIISLWRREPLPDKLPIKRTLKAFFTKKEKGRMILISSLYLSFSLLGIMILRGKEGLSFSFQDTLNRLTEFSSKELGLWPDAFIMVSELKKVPLLKTVILAGGRIFCAASLLGIILCFFKKKHTVDDRYTEISRGALLASFLIIPLAMSLSAERFTILLVPILAVSFCFLAETVYRYIRKIRSWRIRIFLLAVLTLSSLIPLRSAYFVSLLKQPVIYNQTWEKVMTRLRQDTPANSIINTWWPPGHFITAEARRRVSFDGATLEMPVGYWISKMYLSDDEKYSAGILRMINTSGMSALEYLTDRRIRLSSAVEVIDAISGMSRNNAYDYIHRSLNERDTKEFLKLTHDSADPGYLLIYNDLVEKSLAIWFTGKWDFKKAEEFNALNDTDHKKAKEFMEKLSGGDYIRFLWGISAGPVYYDKESMEKERDAEGNIYFDNGIKLNPGTKECDFTDDKHPLKGKIHSVIYLEGDNIRETFLSSASKLSLILRKKGKVYSIVPADRRLATSLLFKLFYLDGKGMSYFKPFIHESDPKTKTEIYVYKIVYPE